MAGDNRAKLVTRLIGMRISAMLLGGRFARSARRRSPQACLLISTAIAEWAATIIMTALIVVFGEVMPKTIAITYPDRVSLLMRRLCLSS